MRLVASVGVIVVWVMLAGLPATGQAALSGWPDPVAQDSGAALPQRGRGTGPRAQPARRLAAVRAGGPGAPSGHSALTGGLPDQSGHHAGGVAAWGPTHAFVTLVDATGPIQDGVLRGDLVVQGGGDPFFVMEDALALRQSLHQLGLRRVTGRLIISGNFFMNFSTNPVLSGKLLKHVLSPLRRPMSGKRQRAVVTESPTTHDCRASRGGLLLPTNTCVARPASVAGVSEAPQTHERPQQ